MKSLTDQIVENKIKELRDGGRPEMQEVVDVLDRVFRDLAPDVNIVRVQSGPVTWMWHDLSSGENKVEKYYILSGSAEEETLGYPMLTIRQAYSRYMDSWITASSLITGRSDQEIMQGISLMVATHMGSFHGYRYSMNSALAAGGSARAALSASRTLLDAANGKFTSVMREGVERSLGIEPDEPEVAESESRSDLN